MGGIMRCIRRSGGFRIENLRSPLTPLCPAGHLPLKGGDRQGDNFGASIATIEVAVTAQQFDLPP